VTKQQKRRIVDYSPTIFDAVDEVIKYLNQIKEKYPGKELFLEDEWTGYEDVSYEVSYYEEETDEEYQQRLKLEEAQRKYEEEQKQKNVARRKKEEEFFKLKRELGY